MTKALAPPQRLALVIVLLFLGGCASLPPPDRPQDFPLHTTDHPFFDLHWRLDREDAMVRAVGLVEASRQGDFSEVFLELQGLDKDGRAVSRALGRTFSGRLDRWHTLPFVVRLRLTGGEERFELKVWAYTWAHDGNGNGRN